MQQPQTQFPSISLAGKLILIIPLLLCLSCSFYGRIETKIDMNESKILEGDSLRIVLADYTFFDWDKVYYFMDDYCNGLEDSLIGTPCNCELMLSEESRYIFLKEDEIVHIEQGYIDFGLPLNGSEMEIMDCGYATYTSETAIFFAKYHCWTIKIPLSTGEWCEKEYCTIGLFQDEAVVGKNR